MKSIITQTEISAQACEKKIIFHQVTKSYAVLSLLTFSASNTVKHHYTAKASLCKDL